MIMDALLDVDIIIRSCEGIPRMDFIGHADPYVVIQITSPHGINIFNYKSTVIHNTANPRWDEEVMLQNVPRGSYCTLTVMDKDYLTSDDPIGVCQLKLDADTKGDSIAPHKAVGSHIERPRLPIQASSGVPSPAGYLQLELHYRAPCQAPGPLLHCGPVRFRITTSILAGVVTGQSHDDHVLAFAAYKLYLAGLSTFFPAGAVVHWNKSYDKACQLFSSRTLVQAVRAQHALLYSDAIKLAKRGVLRGGGDFVRLLHGGVRAGQCRYYTYVLMGDGGLYFSETGAAFLTDIMSKHCMHSDCAVSVVYAGEFCLVPGFEPDKAKVIDAEAEAKLAQALLAGIVGDHASDWTLVIDNNSGTYSPPTEQLPSLAALLRHNLPGLRIEALSHEDARLAGLHARVPSR